MIITSTQTLYYEVQQQMMNGATNTSMDIVWQECQLFFLFTNKKKYRDVHLPGHSTLNWSIEKEKEGKKKKKRKCN